MSRTSLVLEFWAFMRARKKWWLLPIILVMAAVGANGFVIVPKEAKAIGKVDG